MLSDGERRHCRSEDHEECAEQHYIGTFLSFNPQAKLEAMQLRSRRPSLSHAAVDPAMPGDGGATEVVRHIHSFAYNHTPAPEGAVFAAAKAGDVLALKAALDAGGSTEEADKVRPWSEKVVRL